MRARVKILFTRWKMVFGVPVRVRPTWAYSNGHIQLPRGISVSVTLMIHFIRKTCTFISTWLISKNWKQGYSLTICIRTVTLFFSMA